MVLSQFFQDATISFFLPSQLLFLISKFLELLDGNDGPHARRNSTKAVLVLVCSTSNYSQTTNKIYCCCLLIESISGSLLSSDPMNWLNCLI